MMTAMMVEISVVDACVPNPVWIYVPLQRVDFLMSRVGIRYQVSFLIGTGKMQSWKLEAYSPWTHSSNDPRSSCYRVYRVADARSDLNRDK
tara:strand:+ start:682 stop:954 length:273 start_codon:yes stop_codon:yes gene_type:complete